MRSNEVDTYTELWKQYLMMELVIHYYDMSLDFLEKGVSIESLVKLQVREKNRTFQIYDKGQGRGGV